MLRATKDEGVGDRDRRGRKHRWADFFDLSTKLCYNGVGTATECLRYRWRRETREDTLGLKRCLWSACSVSPGGATAGGREAMGV